MSSVGDKFCTYIFACGVVGSVFACMNAYWHISSKKLDNRPNDIVHPIIPLPLEYICISIPSAFIGFVTGCLHGFFAPATVGGVILHKMSTLLLPFRFLTQD